MVTGEAANFDLIFHGIQAYGECITGDRYTYRENGEKALCVA